ncbi:MAG: lactate utilization protein [Minisyncoccia bacterium]
MSYNLIPSDEVIKETIKNTEQRGFNSFFVNNKNQALEKIKSLIVDNSSVMTGSSTTLQEIGFIDFLKSGNHKWINLHEKILQEKDPAKAMLLRRQSLLADYFLGSVNAITQAGQLVAVDASGSRVGAYPYAAGHVILVSGVQKIVSNLNDAFDRIKNYVFNLENERVKKAYNISGSALGKFVILEREMMPNRIFLILVKEVLGF